MYYYSLQGAAATRLRHHRWQGMDDLDLGQRIPPPRLQAGSILSPCTHSTSASVVPEPWLPRNSGEIVNLQGYGPSAKEKHLHDAYPKKRPQPDSRCWARFWFPVAVQVFDDVCRVPARALRCSTLKRDLPCMLAVGRRRTSFCKVRLQHRCGAELAAKKA